MAVNRLQSIDLCRVPYIMAEIRKGTLHWFGHEERMPGERAVKQVLKNRPFPEGKISVGKPRNRCLRDVENDPKKMVARGWRRICRERDRLEIDPEGDQGPGWTIEPVK
jgi:hypothetical protein